MKKKFSFLALIALISLQSYSQSVIVNSNPTMNDRFPKKSGSLRMSSAIVKIGNIKGNETRTDTIKIYNDGAGHLSISVGNIPLHLHVEQGSPGLAPKTESWIAISYNALLKNDYGFVMDKIEFVTNDSIQPKKSISVSANIQEFFPPMAAEDSALVQKAKWIETSYDYGRIRKGSKVTHNFSVINEGKRNLYIRKTRSGCSCLKPIAYPDTIPPGDTAYISVEFDSHNKEGKDSRKMSVYINDPARPEVVLEMKGEIEK